MENDINFHKNIWLVSALGNYKNVEDFYIISYTVSKL